MKASGFNLFVQYKPDNVYIGFNSVSGAVLIFTPEQYEVSQRIFNNPNQTFSNQETELKDILLKSRFLIDDSMDELKILKVRNNMGRHNSFCLGLVIAPTLHCSFSCPYCYVDREKIKMSEETVEKVKKFILKKFEYIKSLQVCWTGGEPLLAIDVVNELNNFFITESKKGQTKFSCSMVTNGYHLDAKNIELLKKCGIHFLQITLDGWEEYHNKLRFTHGGGKTYEQILNNIIIATKSDIHITIRSNLNRDNYEGIFKLIDDLAMRDIKKEILKFTPCKVIDPSATDKSRNLYSTEEFARLEPVIIEYAEKQNINTNIIDMGTLQTFCGANRVSSYVIDPYASLLKCWCNLGDCKNNKVGYINNDGNEIIDFPAFAEWVGWDPFEIEECRKCHVLPLCMGGCKYYNKTDRNTWSEIGCSHRKFNLDEMLRLHYLNLTMRNPNRKNDIQ